MENFLSKLIISILSVFFTVFLYFYSAISFSQNNHFLGSWLGTINASGVQFRIAIHIAEKDGIVITNLDSPDQFSMNNPASYTIFHEDSIQIDFPIINAFYFAKYQSDTLSGVFIQEEKELPLIMHRFDGKILYPSRPQTPKAPFNYLVKDVTIKTLNEKVKLSGTLTLPKGKGPFPAVVLISGNGPQNRNKEIYDHQPFWVLADFLTQNGIATLRYDTRGIGKSTGDFSSSNTFDFTDDAEAVFNFLRKNKKINPSKIGIIGHNEGGIIATIIASRNNNVKFITMMASPSISGDLLLLDQQKLFMQKTNVDEVEIQKELTLSKYITNYIANNSTSYSLQQDLTENIIKWIKEINYSHPKNLTTKLFAQQTAMLYTNNWMKTFISLDPAQYIYQVNCPILALYGENDLQVSERANSHIMKQLLKNNPKSNVIVFPKLNHLFQTSKIGLPAEYAIIEETLSFEFLEFVVKWIEKQLTINN